VLGAIGCSSDSDYNCLCTEGKGSQMESLVKPCVMKKCGLWTAQSVPDKAKALCACVRNQASRDEL
jgi:hypothetical protein